MLARFVDAVMEATVVPSFSRSGYQVRRRLFGWRPVETDLSGRTVLLTGATSGIGRAAAVELARLGARIVTVGRSSQRGETAVAGIRKESGNHAVDFVELDIGDLAAVARFGDEFAEKESHLDALVHNAGALWPERRTTNQDVEMTLAVHLLGPYVLTERLRPLLAATSGARLIFMSSGGMYALGLDLDELEAGADRYDGRAAYSRVKRAQVVLAELLANQYAGDGIVVHSMHPGWADTAGVEAGIPGFRKVARPILRTAEEGADTLVWLVAADEPAASTGGFWHDRARRNPVKLPWTRPDATARNELEPWIEARISRAPG